MIFAINQIDFARMNLVKGKRAGSSYYLPSDAHSTCVLAFPDWPLGEFPRIGEAIVMFTKKEVCRRRGLSGPRNAIRTVYRFKKPHDGARVVDHLEVHADPYPVCIGVYPLFTDPRTAICLFGASGTGPEFDTLDLGFGLLQIKSNPRAGGMKHSVKLEREGHEHPWAAPAAYLRWASDTTDPSFLASELDALRDAIAQRFPECVKLVEETI